MSILDSFKTEANGRAKKGIWFLFLAFVSVIFFIFYAPKISGDGYEYILMQEALVNHLSLDIREADVALASAHLAKYGRKPQAKWLEVNLAPVIEENKNDGFGFLLSPDGNYRSYHFWVYSAATVPFRLVCDLFELDPLLSFSIFHTLLLFWALWSIQRSEFFKPAERLLLLGFFTLHTAVFYFDWIHTEYFSTVLLFVGVIRFLERRMTLALLWVSVASLQNQPIALAIPLIYVFFVFVKFRETNGKWHSMFPLQSLKDWLVTVLSALLVLLPSGYFLLSYGHFNPIAAIGGVSPHWITLSRFFSLWFDLNQGVWLGYLGIVVGIFSSSLLALFGFPKQLLSKNNALAVFLLVILIVISVPCLVQGNWNAGCATMVRYGSWLGAPLMIVFVLLMRNVSRSFKKIILLFSVAVQLCVPVYAGLPAKQNYLNFNRLTEWIFTHFPSLYNPEPEIFAERLLGREEAISRNKVYVFEKDGKITKILGGKGVTESLVLGSEQVIYVPNGNIRVKEKEDEWHYYNGPYLKSHTCEYLIEHDEESVDWLGWFNPDSESRWSVGHQSSVRFDLSAGSTLTIFQVRIKFTTYLSERKVMILLNDNLIYEGEISYPIELQVALREEWMNTGINSLIFDFPPDERVKSPYPGVQLEEISFLYYEH